MWAECLDCNAETSQFGYKVYFDPTECGWGKLQKYLTDHEQRHHEVDCYVADYKDDDRCPFPCCA